ncbi:hypothetical protein RRG08_007393 [Elysia crispata]|uniref:Uncharacterized protein n=1 Tax=Elysia crispata TaxID=231223 RepID=A0AAE1AR35_9GAST|nr:hypothetical protein RRG08_007393 [Elysia crispata]
MNSLAEVSNCMKRGGVVVLNNPGKGNNSGINEITKRHVGETLWREVCLVHHCLVPGQLVQGQEQSPHMHCGAARGGPYRLEERDEA